MKFIFPPIKPFLTILCSVCLLSGCGTLKVSGEESLPEAVIDPDDISEEQLIEILLPDETVVCQVNEKEGLTAYMQNTNFAGWDEVDTIPNQAELRYIIMSYEKVTDEFFLENGAPEVTIGEEWLYDDNGDFYIKDVFEGDVTNYHIPALAGEYIMKLPQNGSDIKDKNDILASWGINGFDTDSTKASAAETFDAISEEENEIDEADSHTYSAGELAMVSKEQKIEISLQDSDTIYTMTNLEEIANFYNRLKHNTWTEIELLPEEAHPICVVTTFQLERHTSGKNLVENEILTLLKAKDQFYIRDIIPSDLSDEADMEIYYSIPDDVAGYIEDTAKQN